jgi:hypothetical protein
MIRRISLLRLARFCTILFSWILGLVMFASIPVNAAFASGGTNYSMADLAGTWESNVLASGYPWWGRSTWAISSDGSVSFTNAESSDGDAFLPTAPITLSITNDGIITISGFTSLQCAMDSGKSIMACSSTSGNGNTSLGILTKKAAGYFMADLTGTWEMNQLKSPGPKWSRGPLTVASDGSASGTFNQSDGSASSLSGSFSITTDGIVNITASDMPHSERCVMDSGKTIVVCTSTSNGGQMVMTILAKKDALYSMTDLEGIWEENALSSPGPMWSRGPLTVGSDGSFSDILNLSEGSTQSHSGTLNITAGGVLNVTGSGISPSERCV